MKTLHASSKRNVLIIILWMLSLAIVHGQSLQFNGTDQYVTVPHQASIENIVNGDFTIEAWVNFNATGSFKTIVAKGGGNEANNTSYFFSISNNQKIAIWLSNGSSSIIRESNTTLSTNTWYHVAVTYDFNNRALRFFLNGVLDGFQTNAFFSSSQADTQPLYIGRQGWDCGCNPFSGSLDEIRIWQVDRTSAEIALSAQFPPAPTGFDGMRGYYNFNEGSGTTLNDNSLNNYHGTLVNSPTWNATGYPAPSISPGTSNWVEFDGATDFIKVDNYTDGSTGAATIEAWIRTEEIEFNEKSFIDFNTQGHRFVLSGTTLRLYLSSSSSVSTDFTPYFGEETHIAVSIANGNQKLYINGVHVDTNFRPFSGFSGSLLMGAESSGSEYKGKMTDIRVWNDVRTETEIQTNITSLLTGSEANLRAFYKMSEGSGTTLGDHSVNSFTGIFNEGHPHIATGFEQKSNFNGPKWTTDAAAVFPEFITTNLYAYTEENRTGFITDLSARIGSAGSPDAGIIYSLSGTDASFFSINGSNGQLSVTTELDFDAPSDADTDNNYEIVVSATAGALVENRIYVVQVTNTDCTIDNEAPSNASSGNGHFSIGAEYQLTQTFKPCVTGSLKDMKLVANQIPTSGTLRFYQVTQFVSGLPASGPLLGQVNLNSISWNNAGLSNFTTLTDIDLSGLNITMYEGNTYLFELISPDGRFGRGPNAYADGTIFEFNSSQTFDIGQDMIFLMDIIETANTAPVFILPTPFLQFDEKATSALIDMDARDEGTQFGDNGTPIDVNVTYSLSGVDAALFDIDVNNGVITFVTPPDFEIPSDDGGDNVYNITVTANDGVLTKDQALVITVQDVNEGIDIITNSSISIAENTSAVATLVVTGLDPAGTLVYSLSGGDDQSLFSLSGADLSFTAAPDFEVPGDTGSDNTYEVQVNAADGFTTDDLLISVTMTDEDEAPVAILLSANTAAENGAVDDVIGTLSVENPDAGDTHTFLIAGGTENTDFKISGDQLLANRAFDFETEPSIDVEVTAKDVANQTLDQTLSITVTDANDAPTDIQLSNLDIVENTSVGTLVATLTTTDQDGGDSHTYTLPAGIESNDDFEIIGNELKTLSAIFDFETDTDHIVRIQTDDGNSGTHEQDFTLNVTDVNEAPIFNIGSSIGMEENSTVVATIFTIDEDAGSTSTYNVSGGDDQSLFTLSGAELSFIAAPNFETPDDLNSDNTYEVEINASDGVNNTQLLFSITVFDTNEAPIFVTSSNIFLNENSSIITLDATDEDAGSTITYSISGGDDQSLFGLNGSELSFNNAPDFETPLDLGGDNTYDVQVSAFDGFNTTDLLISIAVDDINEAPVFTTGNSFSIEENSTAVATLFATDEDAGSTISYSVSGGDDQALFKVNGSELEFIAAADFEVPFDVGSDNTYNVQVSASDGVNSVDLAISVTIIDFIEPPVGILLSSNTVAENGFADELIGTLSAENPDVGDTHTFFIDAVGTLQNSDFRVTGDQLFTNRAFDFETESVVNAMLYIRDGDGIDLQQTLTIEITDNNDVPTDFVLSNTTIDENLPAGTLVGTFTGSDPDINDVLSYDFDGRNANNVFFSIDGNQLKTAFELTIDFSPLDITVQASDNNGGLIERNFTIEIVNLPDAPDVPDAIYSVSENSAIGFSIDQLPTTDADGETISYTVDSGNDAGAFDLSTSGALTVALPLDFEATPSYTLNVTATDGILIDAAVLTINIEDVNEAPTPLVDATFSIDENVDIGSLVAQLDVFDPEGEPLVYSITSGNDGGEFEITTLGSINVASGLNFEITPSYILNIEVSDGAIASSANMTINIEDVNDGPTQTVLSNNIVDENVPIGTVIGSFTTTDEDANDVHTYQLQTTFDFDINGVTRSPVAIVGNDLVTDVEFDFELFSTFQIRVLIEDTGMAIISEDFTITVNDLNEIPSSIELSANSIFENTVVGTIIGTFTTIDGDINDTHTYSLVSGFGDNADFNLSGAQLTNASVFDFETKASYSIKIETNDGNGGTFEQEFEITVKNANDHPTAIALSNDNIDEIAAVGTIIGTLSAVDQDVSDTHTYEVLTSFTFEGVTGFPIQANGSDLITTVPMNFEIFPSFTIDVKTTDASRFPFTETFTIMINDVNEAPTALELSNNSILENSPLNTVIGTLSSVDEDAGDSHTYEVLTSLDLNGEPFFPIVAEGAELITKVFFDFEAGVTELTIDVKTTDENGLSFTESITIIIEDANDAPSEITLSSNTIAENEAIGTIIGNLGAIDQDVGDTHTFSLVSGFGDNVDFDIIGSNLVSASVFDYETKSSHQIKILTDDGNGGTFEQEFTVSVTDINEGDPQSITFDALADRTFDDDPFELTATASSGLAVSYSSSNTAVATITGSTVTVIGVGQTTITASQAGGSGFEAAADVTQTLTVNRASQTITFDEIPDQVFGADPITLSASASSGLGVSFSVSGPATLSGSTLTLTGVGQVTVTANQSGNGNYLAASIARAFVVTDPAKTDQVITFNAPSFVYVNDGTVILEASSDSGLEVTFEIISGGDFANLSGDNLHITAVGTIEVAASQAGDNTFNPATKVATIEIKLVFTLSGVVVDENDMTFTAGTLLAFRLEDQTIYLAELSESGYSESFKDGTYYLAVEPTDGDGYYTTLYGNVIFWESSTPLTVNSNLANLDIKMVAKSSDDLLTGNGTLIGRILDAGNEGGRIVQGQIMDGDPLEGVSVFLIRISDDQIMTEVVSDANGDFEIVGIPEGEYRLQVEVTGVEMDLGNSTISVDAEGTPIELTALVGEDGIVLEEIITSLDEEFTNSVNVYPNPFDHKVSLSIENELIGEIKVKMFGADGRVLYLDTFDKQGLIFEYQINEIMVPSGLVILQLVHKDAIATYRLLKN